MKNIGNKDAPESYEVTWMDKEGNPIYTLVSPRTVYDSQGHFMGGFGVITDITAIKKLEKEVLDTSERERQKIGYELHDDLGQHLIGIDVMTKVLRDRLVPLSEKMPAMPEKLINWSRTPLRRPVALPAAYVPSILPFLVWRHHWKNWPIPHRIYSISSASSVAPAIFPLMIILWRRIFTILPRSPFIMPSNTASLPKLSWSF